MNISEQLVNIDLNPESSYVLHDRMENLFPYHAHQKGQLTYVEGGIAYLNTKDKAYFLPARHFIWIPPGLEHFVQQKNRSSVVRNLYFNMADNQVESFYDRMGIYPANNLLLEMLLFTENWSGEIIVDTFENQFLTTIKNLLPKISKHPLPIILPTTNHEKMQPIINYIQDNLEAPLHLDVISKEFGMSPRTFSRLFQSTLETSFLQYLKLSRMIRAMEQLLQTNKTISEIAYETGYNSIATFSNTFYGLVNVRPSEFQKF
ncbi:helix-turn-helix domain-containing protein [Dyadobacter subterraneus]|uniref:Helix-turn-helix domain-containing protein n=1 Tax=Dyadobacter subterraneus TaxID=2773304 RepID=A0ABR9W9X9_9BACT|nr:AraC family transcriptional regulator [Dyadobacter subterraneus]MBE9462292.1 helix-turn-helix domain-containing protein [Dyadobacter subterraneus]